MPESVYDAWTVVKNTCLCSANAQRESCYERPLTVNDFEEYFLCEVRNCQNQGRSEEAEKPDVQMMRDSQSEA